jgi:hypothetical protein
MKQNLFDKGSELSVFKLKTPKHEFLGESIEETEIQWSSKELQSEAVIIVLDKTDFLNSFETFKPEDNIISFYVEDRHLDPKTNKKSLFQKNYIITQISEIKDDESNNKGHQIKMIDSVSYLLKNTFFSKGYIASTFSNIVEDIFEIFKIKDMLPKTAEIIINKTKETKTNFVIPGNMNLYDFLMYQCNQEGCILYQDKSGIYMKNIDDLFVKNLNKIEVTKTFKQDDPDPAYQFKINDLTSEFNSCFENLHYPKTITYVYDPKNKKILPKQQNFNEIYENINFTKSSEKYIQNTSGTYCDVGEVNLSDNSLKKKTYLNYLKNNTLDMILAGSISGNILLELRDVNILGSTKTNDGYTKGNETLNGSYLVLSISDKIINNKYIQNIILGRVNNTDKIKIKG